MIFLKLMGVSNGILMDFCRGNSYGFPTILWDSKCPVDSIDSRVSTFTVFQELLRAASPSVDAGNLLAMVVKAQTMHQFICQTRPSYTKLLHLVFCFLN